MQTTHEDDNRDARAREFSPGSLMNRTFSRPSRDGESLIFEVRARPALPRPGYERGEDPAGPRGTALLVGHSACLWPIDAETPENTAGAFDIRLREWPRATRMTH